MASDESVVPVTKIRIQIPAGAKIEDVLSKLEITFEEAGSDVEGQFNQDTCCVDVAVLSPISTIAGPD